MSIAEKVFEAVKTLPEQQAAEVLDFVEHLKAKQTEERRQGLDEFFKPYQIDLSNFNFDRDEANAR
ncbi:DUF2281 domain-containing protein [Methylomonas koyamae]|uniref:DUF2281 domain-containing protein n=1 Tax=Methylomonas koyamae TaxID=702114 RepID=UPI002872C8B4|nr:DUF2281 domain-containing protein [Methylomonas koyamae]WNB74541.1 DUF2281 domain-containing protein [Methylomonas koyamae]